MSSPSIKTPEEISIMREGGKILAEVFVEIEKIIKPGISTKDINDFALDLCKKNKVTPAFLGYQNYPATICVGIDDVAVHGIPSSSEFLKNGQIISVDMGIIYQEFYLDMARTYTIGEVAESSHRLLETTKLALSVAIKNAIQGKTVGDIGYGIEQIAKLSGFSVITTMTGHGIGKNLHESPSIPCFGYQGEGTELKAGMVIALEPMINVGKSELIIESDGWTTRTADGLPSAIFENTVLVGKNTAEVLTKV